MCIYFIQFFCLIQQVLFRPTEELNKVHAYDRYAPAVSYIKIDVCWLLLYLEINTDVFIDV
jgi:hypothetical protein